MTTIDDFSAYVADLLAGTYQGPRIGQVALKYSANDFGSVMMEENGVSSRHHLQAE